MTPFFSPQGDPLRAALWFFSFSSDLSDEPTFQQVCHLLQQLWGADGAGILPRLGHDFVNFLDLGAPVPSLDAAGWCYTEGEASAHRHLSDDGIPDAGSSDLR